MKFQRRDLILIAGVFLFMLGLLPFTAPVYAVVIAVLIYFGIKVYVGRRQKQIESYVGCGICADCGSKITNTKCPNCSKSE